MHCQPTILILRILARGNGIRVDVRIDLGTASPERIHAHVVGDPMEPGSYLNLSRFPGCRARPESQKSFLRQFVGIVVVAAHPVDVRMDGDHVAIQKTRVRVLITRFHQFHKCFI